MATPEKVTVNRRAIEAIVEQLIELLDTADRVSAIEDQKAEQECEA